MAAELKSRPRDVRQQTTTTTDDDDDVDNDKANTRWITTTANVYMWSATTHIHVCLSLSNKSRFWGAHALYGTHVQSTLDRIAVRILYLSWYGKTIWHLLSNWLVTVINIQSTILDAAPYFSFAISINGRISIESSAKFLLTTNQPANCRNGSSKRNSESAKCVCICVLKTSRKRKERARACVFVWNMPNAATNKCENEETLFG